MRSTNMFYGYRRLCDARMGGYGKGCVRRRRHSDGIAETIKALLEKAIAFISSLIEKIIAKVQSVKEDSVRAIKAARVAYDTPTAKEMQANWTKTQKQYLSLAAKTLKQAKVAQKALKVALGSCVAFGAAYLGMQAKGPVLQKLTEMIVNKKYNLKPDPDVGSTSVFGGTVANIASSLRKKK